MTTYIDRERLLTGIKELRRLATSTPGNLWDEGYITASEEIAELALSLPIKQERPALPGVETAGIPGKDFIPTEWVDACEKYGKWRIIRQAEWSEADEIMLRKVIDVIEDYQVDDAYEKEIHWLKSLRPQPKQEWSEEDETCLEYALWCVMKTRHFVANNACDLDACRCAERWLESLRPHWKPSEEQMKALKLAYEDAFECPESGVPHLLLKSLLNDLKKL